jgi:acyl dehydratase
VRVLDTYTPRVVDWLGVGSLSTLRAVTRQFDARERFGRYLDDFEVGDVYRHWPAHTITEAENHLFCLLTRAVSPVHTDSHYGGTEMDAGRNMVVGTFVYSLLLGISVPDTSGKAIAALGTASLRHIAPVFHGDTLYGESTVAAKRHSESRPGEGIVTIDTRGRNQDGMVVCEFRRSFLVPVSPQR